MIEVPLYYTGLTTTASVSFNDDPDLTKSYQLRRDYFIEVPVGMCFQTQIRSKLGQCTFFNNLIIVSRSWTSKLHLGSHTRAKQRKGAKK